MLRALMLCVPLFVLACPAGQEPTGSAGNSEGEGEGGGSEGEGEGNGEGEGDGEGEGEGEGDVAEGEGEGAVAEGEGEGEGDVAEGEGEGETPPPPCVDDGDCSLGFVCQNGCIEGCRVNRDCPTSQVCDGVGGAVGSCVACLANTDCADGEVCMGGACLPSCATDADCADGVCNGGVCVGCNADDDCSLGSICSNNECVAGCRADRDCPDELVCGPAGTCVDGCRTSDECVLGTSCGPDNVCVFGCAGDDARCPEGFLCDDNNRCQQACEDAGDCGNDRTCFNGICVDGCLADEDCGGGILDQTGVCRPGLGGAPGRCVQCVTQDQCQDIGQFDQICDTAINRCVAPCLGGFCLPGQVCAEDNLCVQCISDDNCDNGQLCDLALRVCVDAPANGDALCRDCDQADGVCGAGNLCVQRRINNFVSETACGIDCSTSGTCPSGFVCDFVIRNDVAVGAQCTPQSSVIDVQTCVAVREARAQDACERDRDCGAGNIDDGVCVDGVCTLPCTVDSDCLAGTACAPVIDSEESACQ
jgi:hypothetical protein